MTNDVPDLAKSQEAFPCEKCGGNFGEEEVDAIRQ
jgi:hypothetical protein